MKRKFAKQYAQSRTEENWELKRIWRNKANNYRRKAIKEYWKQKADDLKAKPSEFYRTFRPFLSDKKQPASEIHIKANGSIEKDQEKVANILANYFSTMANEIGGASSVNSLTEDDLSSHPSLNNIFNVNKSNLKNFCFQPLSQFSQPLTTTTITTIIYLTTLTSKSTKCSFKIRTCIKLSKIHIHMKY